MDEATRRRQPTPRSVEPLMGHYASGTLPLDPYGERAVREYLGSVWGQIQRATPPAPESPDEPA